MQTYQTTIVTELNDTLIADWKELWERGVNATIFNSYEWFRATSQYVQQYEFHVCYHDGKLAAILPLTTYRRFGVKVSGSIANKFLVDTAFLVESYDEKLFHHFFKNIVGKRNLYIQKIDAHAAKVLQKALPGTFFSLFSVNPYVAFENDPMLSMSQTMLKKVRKTIRKNKEQLVFKSYDNQDDLEKAFKAMVDVDQDSAKKLRSMDLFSKKGNREFYENLIRHCSQFIKISLLYFDNKPIAYEFGFIYKKEYAAYQTAYRNDFKKLRPGKILFLNLIEELKQKSIDILDLGGGISTYKSDFTPQYRFLYNVSYSKNSFFILWWKLLNLIGRTKKILVPEKNTKDNLFIFKTLQ